MIKISETEALIFGGRTKDGKFSNALKIVKLTSEKEISVSVKNVENNFPALASSSLIQLNEKRFLILGGISSNGEISDLAIEFSLNEFENVENVKTTRLPFGVYGHRKVLLNFCFCK